MIEQHYRHLGEILWKKSLVARSIMAHVLRRMGEPEVSYEDRIVEAIYMDIVEKVDAIQILMRAGNKSGVEVIARSVIEGVCGLTFILRDGADLKNKRALAYEYFYHLNQYKSAKEALKRIKGGKPGDVGLFPQNDRVRKAMEYHYRVITGKKFDVVRQEYEKSKKRKKDKTFYPRYWFDLFGGPSNIHDLLSCIIHEDYYDYIYRAYSSVAHSTNAVHRLGGPEDLESAFDMTSTMLFRASETLLNFYEPDRVARKRLLEEMKSIRP